MIAVDGSSGLEITEAAETAEDAEATENAAIPSTAPWLSTPIVGMPAMAPTVEVEVEPEFEVEVEESRSAKSAGGPSTTGRGRVVVGAASEWMASNET